MRYTCLYRHGQRDNGRIWYLNCPCAPYGFRVSFIGEEEEEEDEEEDLIRYSALRVVYMRILIPLAVWWVGDLKEKRCLHIGVPDPPCASILHARHALECMALWVRLVNKTSNKSVK